MNLCLIYLTEWVKEFCAFSVEPQRWLLPMDSGMIAPDVDLPRIHPRRAPIRQKPL